MFLEVRASRVVSQFESDGEISGDYSNFVSARSILAIISLHSSISVSSSFSSSLLAVLPAAMRLPIAASRCNVDACKSDVSSAFGMLRQLSGINLVNVHYKGGGLATLAVVSGEVKAGSGLVANVLPHIKAGKLKGYVVTSKQRFRGAPDIPSAAEAGIPEFESEFWIGVLVPARTPADVVSQLSREMSAILQSSGMQAVLLAQGAEAAVSTPAEFAAFIRSETLKWGRVVRTAGIRPE
jgi:hypothetical protein